jgi:hypothetical protein
MPDEIVRRVERQFGHLFAPSPDATPQSNVR